MKKLLSTFGIFILAANLAHATVVSFSDLSNLDGTSNNLSVDGSGDDLSVVRTTEGNNYLFAISYTGADYDGDTLNDELSYTVKVSGMTGNTVTSSLTSTGSYGNSGSVTLDGSAAAVEMANNPTWELFSIGGAMSSGDSLIFTVESISLEMTTHATYTGSFNGFSAFVAKDFSTGEPKVVMGVGDNLAESYTSGGYEFTGLSETTLYVSSANPTDGSEDWGVRNVDFSITVIPEPTTLCMLGLSAISLLVLRRRFM
jgi:hypothetical protein